jgi:hypothetical protein
MSYVRWVGIDPGAHGAIVVLHESGRIDTLRLFGKTPAEIRDFLTLHVNGLAGDTFAAIERVRSSPQMGVTSAFTFGHGYGLLGGLLVAERIPFLEVLPQTWQKRMGLTRKGKKGEDHNKVTREKKHANKAKAEGLLPDHTWTLDTADAALLAVYARWYTIAGVQV